jgi:hypothetical protein
MGRSSSRKRNTTARVRSTLDRPRPWLEGGLKITHELWSQQRTTMKQARSGDEGG